MKRLELAEWIMRTCGGPTVVDIIGSPRTSLDWNKMISNPEMLEEIARQMTDGIIIPRKTRLLVGIANNGVSLVEAIGWCCQIPSTTVDIRKRIIEKGLPSKTGVCVIDDTSCTGRSMNKAVSVLRENTPGIEIVSQSVVILERMDPRGVNSLLRRMDFVSIGR